MLMLYSLEWPGSGAGSPSSLVSFTSRVGEGRAGGASSSKALKMMAESILNSRFGKGLEFCTTEFWSSSFRHLSYPLGL